MLIFNNLSNAQVYILRKPLCIHALVVYEIN